MISRQCISIKLIKVPLFNTSLSQYWVLLFTNFMIKSYVIDFLIGICLVTKMIKTFPYFWSHRYFVRYQLIFFVFFFLLSFQSTAEQFIKPF